MIDKVDKKDRTFETRLLFLKDIFTNKYSKYDIMAKCIEFKLGKSYLQYVEEVQQSTIILSEKDPLKVLKRID